MLYGGAFLKFMVKFRLIMSFIMKSQYDSAKLYNPPKLENGDIYYLVTSHNPMDNKLSIVRNKIRDIKLSNIKQPIYKTLVGSNEHRELMFWYTDFNFTIKVAKLFNQRAIFKIEIMILITLILSKNL